jgi:hypothetical protein
MVVQGPIASRNRIEGKRTVASHACKAPSLDSRQKTLQAYDHHLGLQLVLAAPVRCEPCVPGDVAIRERTMGEVAPWPRPLPKVVQAQPDATLEVLCIYP